MDNIKFIYGKKPVIEAIASSKSIVKVYINREINKRNIHDLLDSLKISLIPYSFVPQQKLNRLTKHNHQGVVAELSDIIFSSLDQLVENLNNDALFVLLDGITDTRNLGAIIRSAAAAKATAVVIPTNGSAQITGETVKSSAGGVFQIPICRVNHLKDVIYLLHSFNILTIAADEKSKNYLFDNDLCSPLAIVMGSEDKGISYGIKKLCKYRASLPILGEMDSYNVSVAAGMFFYEIMRQRLK